MLTKPFPLVMYYSARLTDMGWKRDFFHRSCQSGKQVQTRAVPTNGFLRTNFYPKCFLHNSVTFLWRPRPLLRATVDYQRQGHRGISFVEAPVSPGNATEVRTLLTIRFGRAFFGHFEKNSSPKKLKTQGKSWKNSSKIPKKTQKLATPVELSCS